MRPGLMSRLTCLRLPPGVFPHYLQPFQVCPPLLVFLFLVTVCALFPFLPFGGWPSWPFFPSQHFFSLSSLLFIGPWLTSLPAVPSNLPTPPSQTLLPALKLGDASLGVGISNASSAPHVLPAAPVQLQGNTLPEAKAVASALCSNWMVHIPLSALTTKSLLCLRASAHSQGDADQSLSVKEGVLTVSAPLLDSKAEGDMSVSDWTHAWPRLVSMIRCYLPGAGAADIAKAWLTHFSNLFDRYHFYDNFALYLKYDICVRQAFIHDHSFNPAHWQEEVWRAILRESDSSVQHSSYQSTRSVGSSSFWSSSLTSKSGGYASQHPPSQPSNHKCIFCGKPGCCDHACGTTHTSFLSLDSTTNFWSSAAGEQVCFKFNGRGCSNSESACGRRHLCSRCGAAHSSQSCSL